MAGGTQKPFLQKGPHPLDNDTQCLLVLRLQLTCRYMNTRSAGGTPPRRPISESSDKLRSCALCMPVSASACRKPIKGSSMCYKL